MSRRLTTLAAVLLLGASAIGGAAAGAQGTAAPMPTAPVPPKVLVVTSHVHADDPADTGSTQFWVDGVQVILRRNTANDVVAANLFLLGGTREVTPAQQGIEAFLLEASERGTRRYPGDAARRLTARLGSTISVEPGDDFTIFGLRATRSTFDSTWSIFADRLVAPTLDPTQVQLVRTQLVNGLRQAESQPDEALRHLADSLLFTGTPYGLDPQGTPASIAAIGVDQLRAFHQREIVRSRMLLVVVGNVERDHVQRLVHGTLGALPAGSYKWTPPADISAATSSTIATEARTLPTNYLLGYYVGPRAGTRDYAALRLASAVLSGRLFTEVRSKRNLSYAVDAPFVERAIANGGLYVTTVDPATTLGIMREEIARLAQEPIAPDALQRLVQQFITDYFLKNETNADQATFLARAALYQGDYRAADRFVDDLRSITPEEIRSAAQRYMRHLRFAYIGDPSKVSPAAVQVF